MQRDKHYFAVGVFVLLSLAGAALFVIWLVGIQDQSKYTRYRIRFDESVSGLTVGGQVKFRGVSVGRVEEMIIDPENPNIIRVDVTLLKTTPVKQDTVATLKMQGVTGGIFIELSGGSTESPALAADDDMPPEIRSTPSTITTLMDMLPQITENIASISRQIGKLLSDKNIAELNATIKNARKASDNAVEVTEGVKNHPSRLLFGGSLAKEDQK